MILKPENRSPYFSHLLVRLTGRQNLTPTVSIKQKRSSLFIHSDRNCLTFKGQEPRSRSEGSFIVNSIFFDPERFFLCDLEFNSKVCLIEWPSWDCYLLRGPTAGLSETRRSIPILRDASI